MTDHQSYPELIALIVRLEGKDKKVAEMALYCLNRQDKTIQNLRDSIHKIQEIGQRILRPIPFMDDEDE
jgi:hypothetical protein